MTHPVLELIEASKAALDDPQGIVYTRLAMAVVDAEHYVETHKEQFKEEKKGEN